MHAVVEDIAQSFFEADMPAPQLFAVAGGMAAVFSMRCPDKERANEDAAGLIPVADGTGVLMVADGMGGLPAGAHAASIAVSAVQRAIATTQSPNGELRGAILDGVEQANRDIVEMGVGAGTTFAAVEIQDRVVRPYHVGDSMILVVGQRGKIKLQTVSHSPVGYAIEAGLIDAVDAMHHDDRHLISNMVGVSTMRIEIGSNLKLAPRDTVLIASDGLFDNLHVSEIVDVIRKGALEEVAAGLVQACKNRMVHPAENQPSKPDDLTFILFRRV